LAALTGYRYLLVA